jgi:hypothetical protein
MQINFNLNNPQSLKGSLIYERTFTHLEHDEIDKVLICFVKNISSSISDEPLQLEINSNVNKSNFQPEMFNFNFKKTINLTFKCDEIIENNERNVQIILNFITEDLTFINNLINENQFINISKKSFNQLDTLIT